MKFPKDNQKITQFFILFTNPINSRWS